MELILLNIVTLSLMILTYRVFGKDIMSPSFLLTSGYFISFLSTLYNVRVWNISVSLYTCLIFFVGMMSFIAGEYLVKKLYSEKLAMKFDHEIEYIKIEKYKYILIIVVCIFIVFLTYREVVRIANLNFASWGNLTYNFKTNVVNRELEGAGFSSLVQQLNKVTKGFAYVFMFVFVNNIFSSNIGKLRKNLINLIPGILFSIQCVIKGGRYQVVAFIIGAMFIYYYYWRKTFGWDKDIPIKYITRIVIIIITIITVFWFSKELVGRLSKDRDLIGYITRYFGGSAALFELYLNDTSMLHDGASETFAGLATSLNKFGFNFLSRTSHEFRSASGITIGNAYSALRNYYHDFGMMGVLIMNLALSIIFSRFYYQLKLYNVNSYKRMFKCILYATFIYVIIFQFFTDYFFAKLSVGLVVEVFIMLICFWFSLKLKVRFRRI